MIIIYDISKANNIYIHHIYIYIYYINVLYIYKSFSKYNYMSIHNIHCKVSYKFLKDWKCGKAK